MGQYRQWLHYRGIDQLLRSQLAVSQHELEQLQAQVEVLGKQAFSAENAIFQALTRIQQDEWSFTEPVIQPKEKDVEGVEVAEEQKKGSVLEEVEEVDEMAGVEIPTISPALLAWSRLPNFDTQAIQEIQKPDVDISTRSLEVPQSDEQLLPTDISAFIDASYPTNPQIKIPWWLHNTASSSQETSEARAIEQQNENSDHLVQRWFERWRQQPTKTKRAQEDQTL